MDLPKDIQTLAFLNGQFPEECCIGCGREFGKEICRCAKDFIHCPECRAKYEEHLRQQGKC